MRRMVVTVVILLATVGAQASELTAKCQATRSRGCECSLSSVELPMSFGEAAGVIALYYSEFPDDRYELLLIGLIRQCLLPWRRPTEEAVRSAAAITQDHEPAPDSSSLRYRSRR